MNTLARLAMEAADFRNVRPRTERMERRSQLAAEMRRYGIHPIPNRPVRVVAEVPPTFLARIKTADLYLSRKAS